MHALRLERRNNIIFFISEITFGALCIWSYFSEYYDISFFKYETTSSFVLFFLSVVGILGAVAVFRVFTLSGRTADNCLELIEKIKSTYEKEWASFNIEWLSKNEQRYANRTHSRINMKTFIFVMVILFLLGILHISTLCVVKGCTLWSGVFLLARLFGNIFIFSLWHYITSSWKLAATISGKWKYYQENKGLPIRI